MTNGNGGRFQVKGDKGRFIRVVAVAFTFHLSLFTCHLYAANKNVGTSGAQFLKIGAGARPVGMGEAFTGIADDINAIAWNPAGLGRLSSPQFTAMHAQWFQQSNFEFLGAAYPAKWGTIGVSAVNLTVDKIDRRAGDTDAADGTFSSNDAAYGLAYGKTLGDDWSVGLNAQYIRESLDSASAAGASADLGVLWQTPHRPLTLGATVKHLGSDLKFVDEGDPLPLTFALGAGYKLWKDRVTLGLDLRQPNDNDLQYGVGGELKQSLFRDLAGSVRAGYNSGGTDPTDKLTGVSVGLGLSWRDWAFDVAWVPYGILGQTFRYAFLVRF
jgi:hypothetical protein